MNYSRRIFIQHLIAAGAVLNLPHVGMAETVGKRPPFGVILGLLKKELENDYQGTLKLLASLGYAEVEFGGTYGASKGDFRSALIDNNLKAIAGGTSIVELQSKIASYIEDAHYFNRPYIICYWPWLDDGNNKNADDFKMAADRLNQVGEIAKKEGLKFAFHNHDKEFVNVGDDKLGYDLILELTDPDLVDMEIDLYWIIKGNADPVKYFEKYPGRFKICHVKDMDKTHERSFEIVGKGIIDFQRIFEKADVAGLKHYILEQDNAPDPILTVTESIKHFRKLRF
jgi:sugar phosphate isomerase/epimerase